MDGQIYIKVMVSYSKLGVNDWAQSVRWWGHERVTGQGQRVGRVQMRWLNSQLYIKG